MDFPYKAHLTAVCAVGVLALAASPASAGTIFTDQTFSLANYSASATYASASTGSITYAQCSKCGDPDYALQFTSATNASASSTVNLAQGLVNTTFSYDPHTQGAIATLGASVDKNIIVNVSGTGFGNTFHPTIEQDGVFYVASIPGATFSGPNTPNGTGYEAFYGDLTAADFFSYDFTTNTAGTLHPDFAGDTILFGLTQETGLTVPSETLITEYDNLRFGINVPEPFTLSVFGAGIAGAVALRRRRKKA